jgi:hypothetical protein
MYNLGIEEVVIASRSPWRNAYVERLIGSIRRECLEHLVVCSERHLMRTPTNISAIISTGARIWRWGWIVLAHDHDNLPSSGL